MPDLPAILAPNPELAARSRAWAMDVRRYLRQEQSQGQISPTDAALLTRLCEFLDTQVAPALVPASPGQA